MHAQRIAQFVIVFLQNKIEGLLQQFPQGRRQRQFDQREAQFIRQRQNGLGNFRQKTLRLNTQAGAPRKRSIEVVVYTSEEPTRFGLGCLGSRALAGELTLEEAYSLTDKDGKSLPQVLEELGYDLSRFAEIPVPKGKVHGAVELHIEQGAVLESLNLPVGIVHTISAPTNFRVTVTGQQRHAGSTPMHLRHDAFLACCEISLELERLAIQSASPDTVATVGKAEVLPGASNVISGDVRFTIDIRATANMKASAASLNNCGNSSAQSRPGAA